MSPNSGCLSTGIFGRRLSSHVAYPVVAVLEGQPRGPTSRRTLTTNAPALRIHEMLGIMRLFSRTARGAIIRDVSVLRAALPVAIQGNVSAGEARG